MTELFFKILFGPVFTVVFTLLFLWIDRRAAAGTIAAAVLKPEIEPELKPAAPKKPERPEWEKVTRRKKEILIRRAERKRRENVLEWDGKKY